MNGRSPRSDAIYTPKGCKGRLESILTPEGYSEVFSPDIVVHSPGGSEVTNDCHTNGHSKSERKQLMRSLQNGHHNGHCIIGSTDSPASAPPPGEKVSSVTRTPDSWKHHESQVVKKGMSHKDTSVELKNYVTGRSLHDTLHKDADGIVTCGRNICHGSFMNPFPKVTSLPRDEVLKKAKQFVKQYFEAAKWSDTREIAKRVTEINVAIATNGTYEPTLEELNFACRMAWRNAPRCSGRSYWSNLRLIDGRGISSVNGMFDLLCQHIRFATNHGLIRSTITMFDQMREDQMAFRIWNPQLIGYAGYTQEDGSVIGDPINASFTKVCKGLGWKGRNGKFDILPLVLQKGSEEPEVYEIPKDIVLEVEIRHPRYPRLGDLGLKWYALPAVSNIGLEVGGLSFPTCAFNGWYMTNEIATRDLGDVQRYNCLKDVAAALDIDMKSQTFWKDIAAVELNLAVLHSFNREGVTIMDHHAITDSFQSHFIKEHEVRGGCPTDWVWVVPPTSGSISSLFHQEMLCYYLSPRYFYISDFIKDFVRQTNQNKRTTPLPKLKTVAWALCFLVRTMKSILHRRPKITVLFGTETGTAERFSQELGSTLKTAFDVRVLNMANYQVSDLSGERIVMFVVSTYGNGDPPYSARPFAERLLNMISTNKERRRSSVSFDFLEKYSDESSALKKKPLIKVRFGVFALGSRAYPKFCGFGRFLNKAMEMLGAQRILSIGEGDSMCEQHKAFNVWAHSAFDTTCETCNVRPEIIQEAAEHIPLTMHQWSPGRFELLPPIVGKDISTLDRLIAVHHKPISSATLMERSQLLEPDEMRKTMLLKFKLDDGGSPSFSPGDHMFIFPENPRKMVDSILEKVEHQFAVEKQYNLMYLSKGKSHIATSETWVVCNNLPIAVSVRECLTSFLDICNPPSLSFLGDLATLATDDTDSYKLRRLSQDVISYDTWVDRFRPNLAETLAEFPSVVLPASFLLSQLPLLQPRVFSISSSLDAHPGEVHLTVGLTKYYTAGKHKVQRRGLCTGWLEDMKPASRINCFFQKNAAFHLPMNLGVPIILLACGTGLAPFRSFWQQRQVDVKNTLLTEKVAPMSLYFGCRYKTDVLFSSEIQEAIADGAMDQMQAAYSREYHEKKQYVQDLLLKDSAKIADLIMNKGAQFYVCGHVGLMEGVAEAILKIVAQEMKMAPKEAKTVLLNMKEFGRFNQETFGTNREQLRSFRPSLSCA